MSIDADTLKKQMQISEKQLTISIFACIISSVVSLSVSFISGIFGLYKGTQGDLKLDNIYLWLLAISVPSFLISSGFLIYMWRGKSKLLKDLDTLKIDTTQVTADLKKTKEEKENLDSSIKLLKEEKTLLDKEYSNLKDILKKSRIYKEHNHDVIIDGSGQSGKTALIGRLTDPTYNIDHTTITAGYYGVGLLFCSHIIKTDEPIAGIINEERHRLRFWDNPGQNPGQITDIIIKNKKYPKILIFVLDPTQEETSFERFSEDSLRRVYELDTVKANIKGVIVYISKSDIVTNKKHLNSIKNKIDEKIVQILGGIYGWKNEDLIKERFLVLEGSAKTGDGLHKISKFIAKILGLESIISSQIKFEKELSESEMNHV